MIPPCQVLLGEGWRNPPPSIRGCSENKIHRAALRLRPQEFYFPCDSLSGGGFLHPAPNRTWHGGCIMELAKTTEIRRKVTRMSKEITGTGFWPWIGAWIWHRILELGHSQASASGSGPGNQLFLQKSKVSQKKSTASLANLRFPLENPRVSL